MFVWTHEKACLRRLPVFYLVLNRDTVLNSYILLMFCVKIVGYRMNVLLKCRLLNESVTKRYIHVYDRKVYLRI